MEAVLRERAGQGIRKTRYRGGKQYPEGPDRVHLQSDGWKNKLVDCEVRKLEKIDLAEEVARRREEKRLEREAMESRKVAERQKKAAEKEAEMQRKEELRRRKVEERAEKDAEKKLNLQKSKKEQEKKKTVKAKEREEKARKTSLLRMSSQHGEINSL